MSDLREYDVIAIGSGSATSVVDSMLQRNPKLRAAVIDKDEPGGICLTRGCIPSKLLLYSADLVRVVERASEFGIHAPVQRVDFPRVMERMRGMISEDVEGIRRGLSSSPNLDYFPMVAEFVEPYVLQVGEVRITSRLILLCTGSRPTIPPIPGLRGSGYLTSDSVLGLTHLPRSLIIVGGGYIAAEFGHFFSAMGSKVTIVARNPQFLPREEPAVSAVVATSLGSHLTMLLNHEVRSVSQGPTGSKKVEVVDRSAGATRTLTSDAILVAVGREPTNDLLHLERTGVKTEGSGSIAVNEYLETSQPGIWAMGDATGKFPFKHKANYDAGVVYDNAVEGARRKVDYHAVPHAIFTDPEVASVGWREREAIESMGVEGLLVGTYFYRDTAKGQAIGEREGFVKVLVEKASMRIVGAHIVGPSAAILLQEIVTVMYTPDRSADAIRKGMHIHPALSEVVERAFLRLRPLPDSPR